MDKEILIHGYGFATYPSVKMVCITPNDKGEDKSVFKQELLFGDYIQLLKDKENLVKKKYVGGKEYIHVNARRKNGYILTTEIQPNRVLEINFIDVGQGDGCHVVTPKDEHFIIDAGKSDNMFRFLSWRFFLEKAQIDFPKFTAIISHCDEDHYGGFTKLFTEQKKNKQLLPFEEVIHNGIVEESGTPYSSLGTIVSNKHGDDYVTDLCATSACLKKRLHKAKKQGRYMALLKKAAMLIKSTKNETATKNEKVPITIRSVKYRDDPIYDEPGIKIEVLGPVVQQINKKEALPILEKSKGKTKNGHSIILKLTIGNLRVLLGGDLNSSSEAYLFKCFTKTDIEALKKVIHNPKTKKADLKKAEEKLHQAILTMRQDFEVDIAKACHHGSPDFTNEFMQAINPIATIISSGDAESHCHPRPETLGAIGKFSRGNRPLIFSTELARSTKEFLDTTNLSTFEKKKRLVMVYGMINVRSDGNQTIIAQQLEKPRARNDWDINKLVWDNDLQEFEYIR